MVGAPPLGLPLANWACGCQPESKASINRLGANAHHYTHSGCSSARARKVRSNEHKGLLSAGACFPCKWADTMRALLVQQFSGRQVWRPLCGDSGPRVSTGILVQKPPPAARHAVASGASQHHAKACAPHVRTRPGVADRRAARPPQPPEEAAPARAQ